MQIIDLSLPLENDRRWMPWWMRTRVRYYSHRFGRLAARFLFGVARKHLPGGLAWANETIHLSTHGTTHVDAPWHFGPVAGGEPAKTIDQVPLDWCYGPGVLLDVRDIDPRGTASVDDLQRSLDEIDHRLKPGEIVLIQTGNDRLWGQPAYCQHGPGVSAEATRWLMDQGIRMAGIDAWGWDRPLASQARDARRTGRDDIFWSAHFVGLDGEFCHIERLANLAQLPPFGFTVCAFPLKVKRGSAGPARVVALLDDSDMK